MRALCVTGTKGLTLTATDSTPPQVPVPPAALLAQLAQLIRDVAGSAERSIDEVVAFLHKNRL